jgi:hypothetical protein
MTDYATFNNQRVQVLKQYNAPVSPDATFPRRFVRMATIGYLDGDHVGERDEVRVSELHHVGSTQVSEVHA